MADRILEYGDFDIPTELITWHEWVSDEFIDGPSGQKCTLIYPPKKTECPNCFTKGAMIKTINGYSPIEDIRIGDFIYDGIKYQKVTNIFRHHYDGDLYNIPCWGIKYTQWMTENHSLFIVKDFKKYFNKDTWYDIDYILQDPLVEKINVKDITENDALVLPFFEDSVKEDLDNIDIDEFGNIKIDDDLLKLFGWWIAEGCISKSKYPRTSSFCLCQSKEESVANWICGVIKDKFNIMCKKEYRSNADNLLVNVHSAKLTRFLMKFGIGAANKHIPDFLWKSLSYRQKLIVLDGYHGGDGTIINIKEQGIHDRYSIATISHKLAYQIYDILHFNTFKPSIHYMKSRITKDGINHKKFWMVTWQNTRKQNKSNVRLSNIGILSKVYKIDKKYDSICVYDIEVENSHRYVVNGFLSSNCKIDPSTGRSSNIYKSGGPQSFTNHTTCPWCAGEGRQTLSQTGSIRLRVYWSPSDWTKFGFKVENPEGSAMVIGYMDEYPKFERAKEVVLNSDIAGLRRLTCRRSGEAQPWGFRQSRYFVQMVERQGR
jgi:hypothetical protein